MIKEVQVFNNNSIYVYFLSCIVIFSYQHFSKKQKISLIYATTIAMEIISQYSWKMTAVMLLMSMFILEEYLSDDKVKCELLSNLWYKIIDFVYQILFIDAGIWIIINIIVSGNWLKDYLIEKGITISLFYGVNICILLITIHKLNTLKFEMCDFKTIKGYFDKFDGKKIEWENYELQQRFEIMVELEDKSFFERKKSYNWFSIEFIDYKIKAYRANREMMKRYKVKKSVIQMLKYIWTLIKEMRFFRYIIGKIRRKIEENTWTIKDFFGRLKSKIRGCSTLEMQLIRNIGIEKGYSKCVIRRKIFEFIYTYLFFYGLKDYYENTRNNKRREFKKFILYVYLHSIKLNIYGNEFKAINKLFEQEKVEEWDIDEFYVAILSLTGAPVTPKRMVLYPYTITHTGINLNRAIAWRNMIRDGRITEIQKEKFDDDIVEKVFYVINGKIIPYIEGGIFYGPNDGKDDWPSYGKNNCWSFARTVYWHIWWEKFSNKAGTDDDMLNKCHSLEERTITPEHCKRYLGMAESGAVIRISDEIKGSDRMGKYKHSQILLDHDKNGITIYQSNDKNTSIEYYTWDEYAEKYKKYKYFKYIKWPVQALVRE